MFLVFKLDKILGYGWRIIGIMCFLDCWVCLCLLFCLLVVEEKMKMCKVGYIVREDLNRWWYK